MGYENSAGGAQPNFRKMFRRVGMAVNSGFVLSKNTLANEFDRLVPLAHELKLYVNGQPFDETLHAVAEQLRETIDDDNDQCWELSDCEHGVIRETCTVCNPDVKHPRFPR